MFKYLICISPLGFMYGSAGAFLSPENLVGRSGAKFPPEAATLSGLFFRVNQEQKLWDDKKLSDELYVAGPFWGEWNKPESFYVPIPWNKIIGKYESTEWKLKNTPNSNKTKWHRDNKELEPEYQWQRINFWNEPAEDILSNKYAKTAPWKFVPILHPRIVKDERCTFPEDGLFLEYAVQIDPEYCLVYLSTHSLPEGWYKFGGENHLVEIKSEPIDKSRILHFLNQKIKDKFALITPGVWGSNRLSQRFPENAFSSNPENIKMLTDKPVPYRYRVGDKRTKQGRLGRGRYSVPAGSVYVLDKPINKPWWEWDEKWFPKEGFSLKKMGCGLCLPIDI
ncbi:MULTISPECIES: type III-B CRISPR module-associated Cmr3 family protein [Nostocales]|jgi:CRISPR-associated protein Cmr3|uniref:type III-B CRISPR module-associated Cmr3 family protein n=1 Tax=Nostocales TaxID=1161 RepID=UPI000543C736|nr:MULTISPECIES: type III-B CRISPR module-associated Cmr3 family protein [Nostocales]KHG40919.1 CRISPR-associated protein [Aphanizomenon flos-aquae 2012/KM1/D3]OBQ16655.1 MAG: CRISPR-associated protein [Anabaena sp. AL93]